MSTNSTNRTKAAKPSIYETVTNAIVEALESGVAPWSCPWTKTGNSGLALRWNGQPYQGINVLVLWVESFRKGYSSSRWMTFKQATDLGGNVRKGETGTQVVYFVTHTAKSQASVSEGTEDDTAGDKGAPRRFFVPRSYTVFNCDQIDGLPAQYQVNAEVSPTLDLSEGFFSRTGARIVHGGDRAFFAPELDYIRMPVPSAFDRPESYASTKAHELVHWSGSAHRLNRTFGEKFGDTAYAREELVAEIGAAFLCAHLGLELTPRDDHAAYIGSWLKVLKDDPKAVFQAASQAQRAVTYLRELAGDIEPASPGADPVNGDETPKATQSQATQELLVA